MKDIADLIGRFLIAYLFLYEVYETIGFYKHTKQTMTDYNITWNQDVLLIGVLLLLIIGGLLVLIGYLTNFGAFLLLLYWIPFTFIVYSFWNDPEDIKRLHSLYFMRNMAVAGGLLLLMANGSGKYSVKRMLHVMRLPKD